MTGVGQPEVVPGFESHEKSLQELGPQSVSHLFSSSYLQGKHFRDLPSKVKLVTPAQLHLKQIEN